MKNILFPASCRLIGWLLFIPALIGSALCYFEVMALTGLLRIMVNDVVIIGIVLGALFIVCSKEPHEDEMIRAIRLSSMLNSLYAYASILIFGTLCVNGEDYIEFLIFNLVLFPIILVFIYRADMYAYYKQNKDEE